ncbi:MAG: hypothetical protein ING36_01455, partial [Burkholderiales bacterium]|nr:hypothetical protein [Burkholderiales bacterium]
MATLDKTTFAGVTYGVMGLGTEAGRTPYKITVAAKGGWGGQPIQSSGYSIGALQFDFGQRGLNIDAQTGKPYVDSLMSAVNTWAQQNGKPILGEGVRSELLRKGSAVQWLPENERALIDGFTSTPQGKMWVNSHIEKVLIAEYEKRVQPVLNSRAFDGWSESDQIVAAATLIKAANQSPENGFKFIVGKIKGASLRDENYTLPDFLADVKAVEDANPKNPWHFSKAAAIAQDYATLRNNPVFGPIIKDAETKIAAPDFSPADLSTDSNLEFMRRLNADSRFRGTLKAAAAQINHDPDGTWVANVVNGSQSSLVINSPDSDYLEIQTTKGRDSIIIKDGQTYFYPAGDVEARRNILFTLEKEPQEGSSTATATPTPSLWDPAQDWLNDNLVQPIKDAAQVGKDWVQQNLIDPIQDYFDDDKANSTTVTRPGESGNGNSSNSDTGTPNSKPSKPATPNNVTHHPDGSTTYQGIAGHDAPSQGIARGDVLTQTFDAEGRLLYRSIRHSTTNGDVNLQELSVDPSTGQTTVSASVWVEGKLDFSGQWDKHGNRVGDRYIVGGVQYQRDPQGNDSDRWVDANGRSLDERTEHAYQQESQRLQARLGHPPAQVAETPTSDPTPATPSDSNAEISTDPVSTLDTDSNPFNADAILRYAENLNPLDLSQGLQVADASAYADSASDVMVSDDPETDTPYTSDDTNLQATQV